MENHKTISILKSYVAIVFFAASAFVSFAQNQSDSISQSGIITDENTIPAIINDSISEQLEFNPIQYVDPKNPDIPTVANDYAVGAIPGTFNVSNLGAAEYSIPIEVPNGGSLSPQISLVYSSHSAGYGLAGYGFSISGLSAITRGEKSLFNNNGSIESVTYTSSDNLYLEGKRLILISGNSCEEGATYCLEGDPYTKIVAHGSYSDVTTTFEAQTTDGKTYYYRQRLSYTNKKGQSHIASWYVTTINDVYGNQINFSYNVRGLYAYPVSISYGLNVRNPRKLVNYISFEYESIGGSPSYFNIEDQKGCIDQRISRISTTSSSAGVYRRYKLSYDSTSDRSKTKFARLVSIQEENGAGESLPPTRFSWNITPSGDVGVSKLNVTTYSDYDIKDNDGKTEKGFFAADLNGDGVSDIIRISNARHPGTGELETRIYISRSSYFANGETSCAEPLIYKIPSPIPAIFESVKSNLGGFSLMDIDGDGYNDILIPTYLRVDNKSYLKPYVILGKDVLAGLDGNVFAPNLPLKVDDCIPLLVTGDWDKNGKDDVIYIEQKQYNGTYPAVYLHAKKLDSNYKGEEFSLSLPEAPEKVFSGDYNNDGLLDLIVLYKSGYKIYFNNGGKEGEVKFSESNTLSGTNLKAQWRVEQGDFDGDGLIDFVYNIDNDSYLWIARNNGDGTFSLIKSDDTGVANLSSTSKDNHRYTLMVYDIDCDGKSDVMLCKGQYKQQLFGEKFLGTYTKWLLSDGNTLRMHKAVYKNREEDSTEGTMFLGDFDGDGIIELANYGSDLSSENDSFTENTITVYKPSFAGPSTGKISRITDGLGNTTKISYTSAAAPSAYTRTHYAESQYPVNTYALPFAVVKEAEISNGAAGAQKIQYGYKDFKIHMGGAGPLGFSEVSTTNTTTKEKTVTSIKAWDTKRWIPTETAVTTSIGGQTSSVVSKVTVADVGGTYFAYESENLVTDAYGNTAKTTSVYDTAKGVLIDQTVQNDGVDMYKRVTYSDFVNVAGQWLPRLLTMRQKHVDDAIEYFTETGYSYDEKGNLLTSVINYGTILALKTTATYDAYGNRLSSTTTGKDVAPITKYNVFDETGRFVIKAYQNPSALVNTFTYDNWGNVLTENDETVASNVLTTTNTYDSWGRLTSTELPDGTITTFKTGWGSSDRQKYYTLTSTSEKPWVLTWYDQAGHETLMQTFGPQNVLNYRTTYYDANGLVSNITTGSGKYHITESFTYDEQGRILTDKFNYGKETAYSYGNRWTQVTEAGKSSTIFTDAWGNTVKTTDNGGSVETVYGSNGKPKRVTSGGATITMGYDEAGNRTSMKDPDAGTSSYEYAADGRLLSQTDARGVETVNNYDRYGRLSLKKVGNDTIKYYYDSASRITTFETRGGSIHYVYDKYGRVIRENRGIAGASSLRFTYTYDDRNRLVKTGYPGSLQVTYEYDDYGFKTATYADGKKIYEAKEYSGLSDGSATFLDKMTATTGCDIYGFQNSRSLAFGDSIVASLEMEFDHTNGNLLKLIKDDFDTFEYFYDNLDRLTSVEHSLKLNRPLVPLIEVRPDIKKEMVISYAPNGNILSKTGVGSYTYSSDYKPHAVMSVENRDGKIPSAALITTFNDLNLIKHIEDESTGLCMDFTYGPDMMRNLSRISRDGVDSLITVYAGNYEKITDNGVTREYYYLDGSTIVIKENGVFKPYKAFTDHLGSILSVFDENGERVFRASYDPWGKQTVTTNKIGLRRGYTAHEMIPEFGIINMNGRLYDPVLGRFFSPDNFVQLPGNTQSYNRYSYCLNNPLKYTDPSGEMFGIGELIGMAVFSVASSMMQAAINGENIWKAGGISLLSAAAAFGIGKLFGDVGNIGKELLRAGAHGVSNGIVNMLEGGSFLSGFATGVAASAAGSYAQFKGLPDWQVMLASAGAGGIAAITTGGNFLKGATQGMTIAVFNHLGHEWETQNLKLYFGDCASEIPLDGGWLNEVVVTAQRPASATAKYVNCLCTSLKSQFEIGAFSNHLSKSLKENSGNSTFGNNFKFYFHYSNERTFTGNQYVRTYRLTKLGGTVSKFTGPLGKVMDFVKIYDNAYDDYMTPNSNWYNTASTISSTAFSWALTGKCAAWGAAWGGSIGAIPGAIIGGVVGAIIGSVSGDLIGLFAIDLSYSLF